MSNEIEGNIVITKLGPDSYRETFASYTGPGGAVPHREARGVDALRADLIEIGIGADHIKRVFDDLQRGENNVLIPRVRLTPERLKELGLI